MQQLPKVLSAICVPLIFCVSVAAQQPAATEAGSKPFGSFSGSDIESVNLENGALVLRIPLYSLPQRGKLKVSYSLTYQNLIYRTVATCFNMDGTPRFGPHCSKVEPYASPGSEPTFGVEPILDQSLAVVETTTNTGLQDTSNPYYTPYPYIYYNAFDVIEPNGSTHNLAYNGSYFRAMDGSGFIYRDPDPQPYLPVNIPLDTDTTPGIAFPPGTIVDASGNQYAVLANSGVSKITDVDGNYITVDSTGSVTDTLGRSIPSLASGGTSASLSLCPPIDAPYQTLGAAVLWSPPGYQGQANFVFCYASMHVSTGQDSTYVTQYSANTGVLQSVVLPDNTYWGFVYDAANPNDSASIGLGNLVQVIFPTGGSTSYDWTTYAPVCTHNSASSILVPEAVENRKVTANGTSNAWGYAYSFVNNSSGDHPTTTETDPLGDQIVHTFTDYSNGACNLYETTAEYKQNAGGALSTVKAISTQYQAGAAYDGRQFATALPTSVTTAWANGQSSRTVTTYDSGASYSWQECSTSSGGPPYNCSYGQQSIQMPFGKVLSQNVYDYATGGGNGTLLGQTQTQYLWQSNGAYLTANLLDTPSSIAIYDSSNNKSAQTLYTYDENGKVRLTSQQSVTTNVGTPPNSVYGHVTTTTKWLNTGGSNSVASTYWLNTGEMDHTVDANGNSTSYVYSSTYQGAYATQVTNALGQASSAIVDFNSGLKTSATDLNGQTTSYLYDSMNRVTSISYPDGGHTTFEYNPASYPQNSVLAHVLMCDGSSDCSPQESNGQTKTTLSVYDGLGRLIITALNSDPVAPIYTMTTYDALGRVASVTNPYRTTSDSTYGSTSYQYDMLGRTTSLAHSQDGSSQTWVYTGNQVLFTDEIGNQWRRISDSLGRLTVVLEPNGTGTSPSMETDYTFDGLNNLLSVKQWGGPYGSPGPSGAIMRTFTYDSFSRLLSGSNPENGQVSYTYDAVGNVLTRTSPAVNGASGTQTVGYCYDRLSRVVGVWSAAPPTGCNTTPTSVITSLLATYTYGPTGSGNNAVGRLTNKKSYNNGTLTAESSLYVYDAMGRVKNQQQRCAVASCNGNLFTPSYTYDKAGNVTNAAAGLPASVAGVPSGNMQFTYGYDTASRLNSVKSGLPESTNPAANHYPGMLFQATSTSPTAPAYGPVGLMNASLGVNNSLSVTMATLARTYDARGRIQSETDAASGTVQTIPATHSAGTITVAGSEASFTSTSATSGSAVLTVSGAEGTHQVCTSRWVNGRFIQFCYYVDDTGSLNVTINGFTSTASYGTGSTVSSVATSLAAGFNGTGSPVTATLSGSTVTVTAKTTGTASNYPISITGDDFTISYPYSTLTGGQNASTVYDAGTATVTISSASPTFSYTTVPVNWGQGTTSASLASSLASAINTAAGTIVTATPNGSSISLVSAATGPTTNYDVSVSVVDTQTATYPTHFPSPSFTLTSTDMSGGTQAAADPNGIAYSYSIAPSGGYDNAGNVKSATDSVTGAWTYGYDTLNRLTKATPSSGSYLGYNGCWSYDPYGNRTAESYQSAACPAVETNLPATAAYNSLNRITTYQYDSGGNVLNDGLNSYLYDAEGRLCAVRNYNSSMTGYIYDADGGRVAKGSLTSWSCNVTTNGFSATSIYALGMGSEQVSEVAVSGSASTWVHTNVFAGGKLLATYRDTDTYFALTDWLGTKRVEITPDQKFSTFFSLPYGNGLSTSGNAADATEHHFTGKERDAESSNDYFGARYYSSRAGRFLSPDWSAKVEPIPYSKLDDPQTLNLYAYVGNNPTTRTDADGHLYRATPVLPLTATVDTFGAWPIREFGDIQAVLNDQQQAQQQNLGLFPTDVATDPGSVTVNWRLRTSDGKSKPDGNYLVFETLDHCGAAGTVCQSNGTAIGPESSYKSGVVGYKDNDSNVFRDGYGGTAGGNTIQKFTVQKMNGPNDLTYDPKRQIPVSIHYGGQVYGSQGIYHGPGGHAPVFVNGYQNIPSVPRLPGEY